MRIVSKRVYLIFSLLAVLVAGQSCRQCRFLSSDAADCLVYGKLDGNLMAWQKANPDCLAAYNIKIASIDVESAGCGSTPSTNAFVNAIRFGTIPNSVRGGLGDFFVQEGTANTYTLADTITIDGTSYSCKDSESTCYNAMKTYFASGTGQKEMEQVCDTVRNKAAVDRETEQSTVRIQMCQDPDSGAAVCGELSSEMAAAVDDYPSKQCSAFGIGPGTTKIPGCESNGNSNLTSGDSKGIVLVGVYAWGLVMLLGW